jgi:hypothetical protein
MKKQTKQGFSKLFDLIEKEDLNLYGFSQLYFLQEKPLSDELVDVFRIAGWIDSEKIPTKKLKNLREKVNELFKPVKKQEIIIPEDKVILYNTRFPSIKISTSQKYARSNVKTLAKAFQWFMKEYDYSWEVIIEATERYVQEKAANEYSYMRTSMYFIRKQGDNKVWTSDLADYCQQVLDGIEPEEKFIFQERVV